MAMLNPLFQRDEEKSIRSTVEDAAELARALRLGPVRFVWTDGATAFGMYMVPNSLFLTRWGRFVGG